MIRSVAGVLMLAVAVVSSAECLAAAQTPEQHACCAAMMGECEMAVSAACCATEPTDAQGLTATKQTIAVIPVAVLVAILPASAVASRASSHVVPAPDGSSSGPPGIPTYLFVASFRI